MNRDVALLRKEVAELRRRVETLEGRAKTRVTVGEPVALPAETQTWLFVRRLEDAPVELATRFDGVIVAHRVFRRGRVKLTNADGGWYEALREHGTRLVLFDWMLPPGHWRKGLGAAIVAAKTRSAIAYCLNVEPRPKSYPADQRWEGRPDEAGLYATEARDHCDRRNLELWYTSWARPTARESFPVEPFIRASHVDIPQPYRVHGKPSDDYEEQVIAEWEELGAKRIILGRGAHELDKSDGDAWRTAEEIAEHRATTPEGADTAWWVPRGRMPGEVLEAIVRRGPTR